MIQSPGLTRSEEAPPWLWMVQIIEFTGWTEQEVENTSLITRRNIMTYLRGKARAEEQIRRKNRNK